MPANSFEPTSTIIVSFLAVAVLLGVVLFYEIAFAPLTVPEIRLAITEASMTRESINSSSVSLIATNYGTRSLSLSATIDNQSSLLANGTFPSSAVEKGHYATLTSSISNVAGFNGINGSIRVHDSPSFNSSTLSIEIVFEYESYNPDNQMIVGKGASGGDSFYLFSFRSLGVFNDFVMYNNNTRYDQQLGDIFALNNWYDLVVTVDGANVRAYVNGVAFMSWQTSVRFRGNLDDFLIGSCICGGYNFNGTIALVRFYDRAISPGEVAWNFKNSSNPTESGLKMWLGLGKEFNGNFMDLSGQNNDGLSNGEIIVLTPIQAGRLYFITVTGTTLDGREYSTSQEVLAQE